MKKFLKYTAIIILTIVVCFSAYALITGRTYLFRAVYHNFADIDDYKFFDNNIVENGVVQPWPVSSSYSKISLPQELNAGLESSSSVGLVVIKNDSLLFEKYWQGYSDSSYSGSFSAAKSITSLLIGAALKEGKIKSLNDKVKNYIPDFTGGMKDDVRIIDLLTMSSGSNWDEAYWNPFSITTEAYYGNDLHKTALSVDIIHKPGTYQDYKSGDTQLLGLVLEKATGKSLSEYASEKIWKPIGATMPALWSTDKKKGNEKAYCCFNTNARDFARIGSLMLHKGNWKGIPVIDTTYCEASSKPCMVPTASGAPCNYYGYQWWILPDKQEVFFAWGILGQYIIVIPEKQTVIVRLGNTEGPHSENGMPQLVYDLTKWAGQL